MTEHVDVMREGRVAVARVERPPLNVLSTAVLANLEGAISELHADDGVGAIVLARGARAFAAGADIRELAGLRGDGARAWLERAHALMRRIEEGPKPVVAAIAGHCLGGGLELALACHLRVAGESARLGQPEIKLGAIPGWGGSQRLPRLIGPGRALEMLLTGEPVDAAAALRIGLVSAVVPDSDLLAHALRLAASIAQYPASAVAAILAVVREGLAGPPAAGLALEVDRFVALVESPGYREGTAAFLEKRPPRFHG